MTTGQEPRPAAAARNGVADPPLPFSGGRIPASDAERKAVERRVIIQYFLAPALALAVALVGLQLERPQVSGGGVLGLGLVTLVIGALAILERRLLYIRGGSMTPRSHRYFIYEGLAAIPFGLVLVTGGLLLTVGSLLFLSGVSLDAIRLAILVRPHLALLPVGALLLFQGLGFVIGFRARANTWRERLWLGLQHLPALLGGLILLGLSAATLALGLLEWLQPERFHQWFHSCFGNPWPWPGAKDGP